MAETHENSSDPHSHGPAAPPEPKTPMWLTALGAVLFLVIGLIWGLTPATDAAGGTPAAGAAPAGDAGAPSPR